MVSQIAHAQFAGAVFAQEQAEFAGIGEYLSSYGERLPAALAAEQQQIAAALAD